VKQQGVGLMIERSWVRLPVGSLSSGYYSYGDCLQRVKLSRYIPNTKVNTAFLSFDVFSTSLSGWK